jgi:hypothetical protein
MFDSQLNGRKWMSKKRTKKSRLSSRVFSWSVIVMIVFSTAVLAGAIRVKWNANTEPDLAGYKVYYGQVSNNYEKSVDVGDVTEHVLSGLAYGKKYYVAVTAYDDSGNESERSPEVSMTLAIPQISVAVVAQGLQLQWHKVAGADAYEIYRNNNPYFTATTPITLTPDTVYVDTDFRRTPAVGSYYQVVALQNGNDLYSFPRLGGYTIGLYKGANLVSLPFLPGDELINNVIGSQLTGGRSKSSSDYVMVFKADNQTQSAWQVEGTGSSMEGKWVSDDGGSLATLRLPPDQAFWIYRRENHADSLLTFTGLVCEDSNRVITMKTGFNFIGSCYPSNVTLVKSELGTDGVMKGSASSSSSDKVIQYHAHGNEFAWLVAGTNTNWDGQFLNESGTASTSIMLRPGIGYLVWIKGANPSQVWTYPNPKFYN